MELYNVNNVLERLKYVTSCKSDYALAKSLSVSPQQISSWRKKGNLPYSHCVQISLNNKISLDWLILGRKKTDATENATVTNDENDIFVCKNNHLVYSVADATENVIQMQNATENEVAENTPQCTSSKIQKMGYESYHDQAVEIVDTGTETIALVPEADLDLAAGMGRYPNEHTLYIGKRPFSVAWLKRKVLNPKNLRLARVYGDSMIPLIHDKNLVMIDIKRPPSSHSPVAFRLNNELYIKNYQVQGNGTMHMISRNKAYDNIIIDPQNPPDDFAIIGSVVWHSHSYV